MKQKNKFLSLIPAIAATLLILTGNLLADGLPGEYYITQRWRDLLSPYSAATNPAFLTEANYVTVRGAFAPTMGGTFTLFETGVTVPVGLYQSVGFTFLGVNSSEKIQPSRWDGQTRTIIEDGEPYSDNHFHLLTSYAVNPWNRLSLGANLTIYRIPNFGDPIHGFALDLGASYRLALHPVLGEHLVGISFLNVLSPDFEFDELQQQSINAKISWDAKLADRRIHAGIDLDFKDFTSLDQYGVWRVGDDGRPVFEKKGDLEFDFNSRIGFWLLRMINVYGLLGNNYAGAAAGMNVPTVFGGRDFHAAYQYMSMFDDDEAYSHTVYFRGEFGLSREQIHARKLAREDQIGPGDLWTRALRAYTGGRYWDAMLLFGRILVEYPDFFNNNLAVYYMGRCQEEMEMREFATQNFAKAIAEYPASRAVPYSNLGLLRLSYRDGIHSEVERYHGLLMGPEVSDSIKNASNYYLGTSYLNEGDINRAQQYLQMLPMDHDDYPFAQHSLGVIAARRGDLEAAAIHLDNVVQFRPKSSPETAQQEKNVKAQREIINRSSALLGMLYFEQGNFGPAIAAFRNVDRSSAYDVDALIGTMWTAFNAGQWDDVHRAATALQQASNHPVVRAEAAIMLGYYHMSRREWAEAVRVLDDANNALYSYNPPTDSEMSDKEMEYYEKRGDYFELAQAANDFALTYQSSYVLQQLDSLRRLQPAAESEIRNFFIEQDDFEAAKFFARDPHMTGQIVTYALAKASEQAGVSSSGPTREERRREEEIERQRAEEEELLELLRQLEGGN